MVQKQQWLDHEINVGGTPGRASINRGGQDCLKMGPGDCHSAVPPRPQEKKIIQLFR